jgi:hypothetical protein
LLPLFSAAPSSCGGLGFVRGEAQAATRVALARLGRALIGQWTGGTVFRREMGHEGFLSTAEMHPHPLPVGAGDFQRLAILVNPDGEISQVEFVRVWLTPPNGSLDVCNALLLLPFLLTSWSAFSLIFTIL